MHLTRKTYAQLAIFIIVALISGFVMSMYILKVPAMFGVGRYLVTVELPVSGGLYASGNVTYRGTNVGRVQSVELTDTGVKAVLSLDSNIEIPSDLKAEVHSVSAIGEQYVDLLPADDTSPRLRNGDVIPLSETTVPPDINALLDATNRGLQAIPRANLKTVIDEGYIAVGGMGPDIARLIKGGTNLAIDARANQDALTSLIDQSKPVLDSQTDTADSIQAWAANLAEITASLQERDAAVRGVIRKVGQAAEEARALFARLKPSLPLILANLVSVNPVAITYQPNIEQLLVLLPQAVSDLQAISLTNRNTRQDYKGVFLSFNLNLNIPPPCVTGFLPATQQRSMSETDYPERPAGDIYCRIPQDAPFNVRGARNIPCETVPGKRAPSVKMCESNENYVPLNDGNNWKGDPNATLSGQPIPQLPPGTPALAVAPNAGPVPPAGGESAPPPPLIAAATYDPATGAYIGPDGQVYTNLSIAQNAPVPSLESMLLPPEN